MYKKVLLVILCIGIIMSMACVCFSAETGSVEELVEKSMEDRGDKIDDSIFNIEIQGLAEINNRLFKRDIFKRNSYCNRKHI